MFPCGVDIFGGKEMGGEEEGGELERLSKSGRMLTTAKNQKSTAWMAFY